MLPDDRLHHTQQIELHIPASAQVEEEKDIILQTQSLEFEHIEYKLNASKNEIIVTKTQNTNPDDGDTCCCSCNCLCYHSQPSNVDKEDYIFKTFKTNTNYHKCFTDFMNNELHCNQTREMMNGDYTRVTLKSYNFDEMLLNVLEKRAKYHQSSPQNKYFNVEEIMAVLIFLRFPLLRMLSYKDCLTPNANFISFYDILRNIDTLLNIKKESKNGYTILNTPITSTSPIIFFENIEQIMQFLRDTNNQYHGAIFRVSVHGKFISLLFIEQEFKDIFLITAPTNIQINHDCNIIIATQEAETIFNTLQKQESVTHFQHLLNQQVLNHLFILCGDKIFDDDELTEIELISQILHELHSINITTSILHDFIKNNNKQITQYFPILFDEMSTDQISCLISEKLSSRKILQKVLFSYRSNDVAESEINLMAELLINLNNTELLMRVLMNIKTMYINMPELCSMIWFEFINNGVDKMAIIKLRRICEQYQQQQMFSGQSLLEYKKNNIMNSLPSDIQHIPWNEYIEQYMSQNFPQTKKQIIVTEKQMDKHEKVEIFLNIIQKYNKIINTEQSDINQLHELLDSINKEFAMSQIMDVFFDLKHGNNAYLNKIKTQYECQYVDKCKILDCVIKTREYGLRSRVPKTSDKYINSNLNLKQFCMMEMLEFIHLRLFHKDANYRNRLPNRAGITDTRSDTDSDSNLLFKDILNANSDLLSLQVFCNENQYDSDALYDDMFNDQEGQSNIYDYLAIKDKKINLYYSIKDKLYKYTIKPSDKEAMKRNLIELDFGDHLTEWNVDPMFLNMKQEWMKNEFYALDEDIYNSLEIKSGVITNQNRNTSTYNLLINEILCIKVYTDTNELQSNFRHAFRCSSEKKRRAQFVHWATNLSIIFLKIEALNQAYNYNKDISNFTLYHGLNRLFSTRGLVRQFYGALSTTWELSSAHNFAGSAGMILQINKAINDKNVNAVEVDWISCHDNEQEVLLMNPQVIIQKSYVFTKDFQMKISFFKDTLSATLDNKKDLNIFENLSSFFQSEWISSVLENTITDKEFVNKIDLFTVRESLNNMNLFQFIFFECNHYQIATYVVDTGHKTEEEVFAMIIDTDFFMIDDDGWIQSVDRSQKLFSKYMPRMCTTNIIYQYGDDKITKEFATKQAKPLLINTDLILQYIDQRKLYKSENDLTINIEIQIKYQYKSDDNIKSQLRIWKYKLTDLEFKFGNIFKWKMKQNAIKTLTNDTLYISSLYITKDAAEQKYCDDDINENQDFDSKTIRWLCQENIFIEQECLIDINAPMVICCKNLKIDGILQTTQSILIITNSPNKNLETKINGLCKFGFIKTIKNQHSVEQYDIESVDIKSIKYRNNLNLIPYDYQWIDKLPLLFATELQITYLKSQIQTVNEDDCVMINLSRFFNKYSNRQWITNCLQHVIGDKQYIEMIDLFASKTRLYGMNVFEFIFFECGYYEIANYVTTFSYCDDKMVSDMILGSGFPQLFIINDNNEIRCVDRKYKLLTYYSPTKCEIGITYEYDNNDTVYKTFMSDDAMKILNDTSLILKDIDQNKLEPILHDEWNRLTIWINIDIEYGQDQNVKSIWKCNVNAFKFELGTEAIKNFMALPDTGKIQN
eukprot:162829_1